MKGWIEVTRIGDNEKVFVQISQICGVMRDFQSAKIRNIKFAGTKENCIFVSESVEEIMKMIEANS